MRPPHARGVLLRWRRDGRRRRRSAGADGPPVHQRAGVEGDDGLRQLGDWRPSGSATTRSGRPSTTSSTRATRSSPTASSCRRGSPPAPSGCASARCSTSCRSGTRCAWPRTSPRCTTCRAAGRSSASAAAPCPARCSTSTTRACRSAPTTTPSRPPTTSATAGCSRSRWRSSAGPSPRSRSRYQGELFQIPVPGIPDRGSTVQTLTLVPRPLYPYEIWQAVTSPPTLEYVPGRRPRRRVLEPAPRVHQALLGHLRRALRRGPRRPRAGARRRSGCSSSRCASRTPTRRPSRRRRRATTSSGSSSARTAGAAATWAPTASRPRPGLIPTLARVDREQDDPPRHAGGGRRGRRLLPRPARPRAPDDLPPPPRRPLQEGRRADGPLRRRGRPAPRLTVSDAPRSRCAGASLRRTDAGQPSWQAGHQYSLRAPSTCIATGVPQTRHGRPARRYT